MILLGAVYSSPPPLTPSIVWLFRPLPTSYERRFVYKKHPILPSHLELILICIYPIEHIVQSCLSQAGSEATLTKLRLIPLFVPHISWFSFCSNFLHQVKSGHKAEWSHELIAGAASYEAAKAYEKHCAENGKPASHTEAKEIMAGIIGAFVDREVETKGLDFIDRVCSFRSCY